MSNIHTEQDTNISNVCLVQLEGSIGATIEGHSLTRLEEVLTYKFNHRPSEDVLAISGTGTAEFLVDETMKLYRTLEQKKGIGQVSLKELQIVAIHQGYETRIVKGLEGISYFTPQEIVELEVAQSGEDIFQKRYS